MFGKKGTEKRSLEDMFKPSDDVVDSDIDETTSDDFEENEELKSESNTEKSSYGLIKPLDCFGMEEEKTEKWLFKCVKVWYYIMSFVWFLFGAVTFAPVIFIGNKLNAVLNDKKKSTLFAVILHVALITILFVLFLSRVNNANSPTS